MWGSKTRGQAGPVFSSYKTHTIFPCSSLCRIRKDLLSRMPSEVGRCNFLVSCVRARSSAITTLQSGFFAKGGGGSQPWHRLLLLCFRQPRNYGLQISCLSPVQSPVAFAPDALFNLQAREQPTRSIRTNPSDAGALGHSPPHSDKLEIVLQSVSYQGVRWRIRC